MMLGIILKKLLKKPKEPATPAPPHQKHTTAQRRLAVERQVQCYINSGPRYWKVAERIIDLYTIKEQLIDRDLWEGRLNNAKAYHAKKLKKKATPIPYGPRVKPSR